MPKKTILFTLLALLFSTDVFSHTFKVLVFSKTEGFRHASIPAGIAAIQQLGLDNNFEVDATESASDFTFSNLIQYDAVIFLSTTGDVLNADQQNAFEQYIQSGGGFVGIHAASDTEYNWPWYGQLVGAYFDSHPENQTATIKVLDRVHPSTSHLGDYWQRFDEWYNYQTNPRGKVHVLAVLDESTYNGGNMGYDHPIAWMHNFDGGRSWYTGGGHTSESFSEPDFLAHILGGILYASGDVTGQYEGTIEERFEISIIDNNPSNPMELAVLPNLDVLYIERGGTVKLRSKTTGLVTIAGQLSVDSGREDGLIGIVLDPDFENNNKLYLFYSPTEEIVQRVSRFTFDGSEIDLASEEIILKIPIQRDECCHSGGDMEFDGNGNLFITTGDNTNPFLSDGYSPIDERPGREAFDAQGTSANTKDLRGKILRIQPQEDGSYSIPDGNLFADTTQGLPEIYVMGTRNPFRMAVHKEKNELVWGDIGPDSRVNSAARGPVGYDEFNKTSSAGNFGWPYCIGSNIPYADYNFETGASNGNFNCQQPVNDSPNNTGLTNLPPAIPAWISYPYGFTSAWPIFGDDQARSAMAGDYFYFDAGLQETGSFPEYFDGSLFLMEWTRNWILEAQFDDSGQLLHLNPFLPNSSFSRPIDMQIGPDGAMYMIEWGTGFTGNNPDARVIKIEYAQNLGNRAPFALASSSVQSGIAPLTIEFYGDDSRDPDVNDQLSYAWDFDGDDEIDATTPNATFTFTKDGNYLSKLTVTDLEGESAIAQVQIVVGNSSPEVTIVRPLNGGFYEDFDVIEYEVQVSDTEQGVIGDGILCSDIITEPSIGHDDHSHGAGPRNGCIGSFKTETHGDGPDNVFYVFNATYSDDGGGVNVPLTGSDVVILQLKRKQAEHALELFDLQPEASGDFLGGGQNIGFANNGSAMKFGPMNFENIDFFTLRYAALQTAAELELRIDAVDGPLIAKVNTQLTGDWQSYDYFTTTLDNPGGTHDVYLVFKSTEATSGLGNINWIEFHGQGIAKENPDSLVGLAASYFPNADFSGTPIIRKDPMIAWNWKNEAPHTALPQDHFSVRWEGTLTPESTTRYRFYSDAIGGSAQVWLDDEMIMDLGESESPRLRLEADTEYDLKVEYAHNSGYAGMFLRWEAFDPPNVIHADYFSPDELVLNVANETESIAPVAFELYQNYPNPFNPSTQIQYSLPTAGQVSLKVFNTLGQNVQTLVSDLQPAGQHTVTFNAGSLSSGVYFYQLEFENRVITSKMLLLK